MDGFAQGLDCDALKTGTFEIETEHVGVVQIFRGEHMQVEVVPELNKQTDYSIVWTGPCLFEIQYKSGDHPPGNNSRRPIICEITEITDSTHMVRSQIEGTDTWFDYVMREIEKN